MIPNLLEHARRSNVWMLRFVETRIRELRGDTDYFDGGTSELLGGTIVPDQWYAVLEAEKVGDRPVGIHRLGENLVLWRDEDGQVTCARDRCPHRGAKLSQGFVNDGCIECPYHGFEFAADGHCTSVPALGPGARVSPKMRLSTYPVREEQRLLWVWWGAPRTEYPEVPWFEHSDEQERNSASRSGIWKFHYSRAIENGLDAHHFPFVHGSINPSCGTYVAPFSAEEVDGEIRVSAGLKRQPTDPDESAVVFHMRFRFPNVNHARITDQIQLQQISTPIDDDRTWMYVRYYQDMVELPIVGPLLSAFLVRFDWAFAQEGQDIPIFKTQRPKAARADSDYCLIEADRGVSMYLRTRDRLITEAEARAGTIPITSRRGSAAR